MTAKKNTVLGIIISIIWFLTADVTIVQIALGLSFLVLIPLLLHIAVPKWSNTRPEKLLTWLSTRSFIMGIFGLAAITLDQVVLSVTAAFVWFVFTIFVAWCGVNRVRLRGLYPAEETIIDVGLIFLGVGGFWLVLSEGGIDRLLPYDEVTMQLTAVHYHYSAAVIPILTGAFGRLLVTVRQDTGRAYRLLAIGTACGSPLIALGVIQGPPLELVYVGIYSILLYWLCIWWLVFIPNMTARVRICILLASASLMISMGVSVLYAWGATFGNPLVNLADMFFWHGAVNALGFSLFGVLGWYLFGSLPKRQRIGDQVAAPVTEKPKAKEHK
ncbi:YndJ family protein [Alkalicoccus chagannorensis]|uniref:YndJ family protein n=1 Tax=Alkalicoccus chagannorensis TaxID=427072 RepID=UPI00040802DC|nr:YndJ family protein [Alkalicoccus chagannorensis]